METLVIKLVLILVVLVASDLLLAADGYEEIKFGINLEQLKKDKVCSLQARESADKKSVNYICHDFKYAKRKTTALFYFVDQKLERIVFSVGQRYLDMQLAAVGLRHEFGSPTSMFDLSAIKAYNKGVRDQLSMAFDKDTVFLKFFKLDGKSQVTLSYSSEDYYEKFLSGKKETSVAGF
jgi:hypothetical protein